MCDKSWRAAAHGKSWIKRQADARDCVAIVVLVAVLAPGLMLGCKALGIGPQDFNPADCPKTALAEIETAYVTETVRACRAEGATSREVCKAWPAIRDKYAAERQAWVGCEKKGPSK